MASEKVLEAKKAKVVKLTEQLQSAVSCVFVDYKGITVEQDTKLRKELREAGVHYSVEKNTMLRFALHNIGMPLQFPTTIRLLPHGFWASSPRLRTTSST